MVESEFNASDMTYGYRRVTAALHRKGVTVSADTVRSIMREKELRAAQPRRKVRTTVPADDIDTRPDLVGRDSRRPGPRTQMGRGHRAPRGAVRSGGDERASPPACRGGPVEAGGSPIPGTGVRAGSGPDNDGTHQYCQMVRARLARRRGIRRGTSG